MYQVSFKIFFLFWNSKNGLCLKKSDEIKQNEIAHISIWVKCLIYPTFHILLLNIYIYIYIYILSSADRSVSFYQNSSVWLDRLDSRRWDRNAVDSKANPRLYHSAARILKTCQKRWMIGRSGERGSGISVLKARHDDIHIWFCSVCFYGKSTIGDYLMSNPLYTYILDTYNSSRFVFMIYQLL